MRPGFESLGIFVVARIAVIIVADVIVVGFAVVRVRVILHNGHGLSGDGEGASLEGVHEVEVRPGGGGGGADDDPLLFGAVAFAELFDFVTALGGGF